MRNIERKVCHIGTDDPAEQAVVGAFFSRSGDSLEDIVARVKERGALAFMEQAVFGWGHNSVLDCVNTDPVCVDGFTDLAQNIAICASLLVNAQMQSTRYQHFTHAVFAACMESAGVQLSQVQQDYAKSLYDRYQEVLDLLTAHANKELSHMTDAQRRTWVTDRARQFLPKGTPSRTMFVMNARQWNHVISFCLQHELQEVRDLGQHFYDYFKAQPTGMLQTRYVDKGNQTKSLFNVTQPHEVFHTIRPSDELLMEIRMWKDSGYKNQYHRTAGNFYAAATVLADDGARRDLNRNRGLHQSFSYGVLTETCQPFWSMPEVHGILPERLLTIEPCAEPNVYISPMCTPQEWNISGHVLDWLYAFRLRTEPKPTEYPYPNGAPAQRHPSYSVVMYELMGDFCARNPRIAAEAGIVYDGRRQRWDFEDRLSNAS